MDDLSQQLNALLSDPNRMRQLQGMVNSLGLGQNSGQAQAASSPEPAAAPEPAASPPNLSALAGALGALGGGTAPQAQNQNQEALAMVTRLAPLLGRINQEDDSTRLLRALRPLLSEERRRKIDEAIKILQLMRLLPLLKDMGGLF